MISNGSGGQGSEKPSYTPQGPAPFIAAAAAAPEVGVPAVSAMTVAVNRVTAALAVANFSLGRAQGDR